jgi:large subunit ribosomal protein L25
LKFDYFLRKFFKTQLNIKDQLVVLQNNSLTLPPFTKGFLLNLKLFKMKTVSMSGSPRENVGKKDAKRARRQGQVPCVLYGGEDQVMFLAEEKAFKDIVYSPEVCLVSLEINGKTYKAVLQDIQFHPLREQILHADFLQIFDDKPVKIAIPVKLVGTSPGVLQGGKLVLKLRKLLVKGLPAYLPDFIEVSIAKLKIGENIKVEQLSVNNLEFLDAGRSVVAQVKTSRTVVAADEEEEEAAEGSPEGEAPAAE